MKSYVQNYSVLLFFFLFLISCSTSQKVTHLEKETERVHKGHSGKHLSCSLCNPDGIVKEESDHSTPSAKEKINPKASPELALKLHSVTPRLFSIPSSKNKVHKENLIHPETDSVQNIQPQENKKHPLKIIDDLYEVTPNGTNKLALYGFIFSLIALVLGSLLPFIGFLLWVAGLVLSIVGLIQIRKAAQNDELQKGKGFAIAGIIISIVPLILFFTVLALVLMGILML